MFGPVVATCLDLGVIVRFAPLREPWRNGVIEHFNDVWDCHDARATGMVVETPVRWLRGGA